MFGRWLGFAVLAIGFTFFVYKMKTYKVAPEPTSNPVTNSSPSASAVKESSQVRHSFHKPISTQAKIHKRTVDVSTQSASAVDEDMTAAGESSKTTTTSVAPTAEDVPVAVSPEMIDAKTQASADATRGKWLTRVNGSSIYAKERQKKSAETCTDGDCPLPKNEIPVFGIVMKKSASGFRKVDGELETGSYLQKTPALYIK